MARAALLESSAVNAFPFGGAQSIQSDATMKRKTPSELRGEQLKRRSNELLRTQKYIDTRVSEVYPVKKSSERCIVPNGKEKAKDSFANGEVSHGLINPSPAYGKENILLTCDKAGKLNNSECSNPFAKDIGDQDSLKIEKYDQHNVAELHLGKKLSDSAKIDMDKALKGLIPRHIAATSDSSAVSSGKLAYLPSISPGNLYTEFLVKGYRPPLDFTLKTTLRLVSSTSVIWCHRISSSLVTIDLNQFNSQLCCNKDQKIECKSGLSSTNEVLYSKALHSWLFPQSSLPSSVVSIMASSSIRAEKEFLQKRQKDWEDSFQNLYYLLRKNLCSIFYVYTSQFVVLFIGGNFLGKKKRSCNAYISQSTRGLRSLLRKHDICFSMPLCHAEAEQASDEDLVELSEIEKRNLGQTFHLDSLSDVDNSPQSLLSFIGNENVHGLYDFLLNYRVFLTSLTGVDVPVLYAPVPFQNASLSVPEVRCKEMKRADMVVPSSSGSGKETEGSEGDMSASGICYSIEIKDTVLLPWTVCGVCVAMGSDGRAFESSFTTDPSSIGLNAALDSVCQNSDASVDSNNSQESGVIFGIPEAVLSPYLRTASLRHLKYSNGSYTAHVTPI